MPIYTELREWLKLKLTSITVSGME